MLQLPVATLALQLCVPSLTVTLPVGVPPVIVVVVPAAVTVWDVPADVLPAKFASPPYVAVSVLLPAVAGVRVQVPAATEPLQFSVPSLTVTLPVGVPPPEVTVNATAIPCPTTDGFGVWLTIVVVVPAVL